MRCTVLLKLFRYSKVLAPIVNSAALSWCYTVSKSVLLCWYVCQYTIYGETNAKVDYVLVISQYEYDISVIT